MIVSESMAMRDAGRLYPIRLDTAKKRDAMAGAVRHLIGGGWDFQPFRGNEDKGYGDPNAGGLSNQVDGVAGGVLQWLLTGERACADKAIARAFSLDQRVKDKGLNEHDGGHAHRWDSIALASMASRSTVERRHLVAAFLRALHRAWNSRYVVNPAAHMRGGVRPQWRASHVLFSYAHYLQALDRVGALNGQSLIEIPKPKQIRDRAVKACAYLYESTQRGPRGWGFGAMAAVRRDPVTHWGYLPGGPMGQRVVAFHYLWIQPYELLRAQMFCPGRVAPLWRNRLRINAQWSLDMCVDPNDVLALKAGRNTFTPAVFKGEAPIDGKPGGSVQIGPFRSWADDLRRYRGENSYPLFPLLAFAPGAKGRRLALARKFAATCKTTYTPGEIEPSFVWAAAAMTGAI